MKKQLMLLILLAISIASFGQCTLTNIPWLTFPTGSVTNLSCGDSVVINLTTTNDGIVYWSHPDGTPDSGNVIIAKQVGHYQFDYVKNSYGCWSSFSIGSDGSTAGVTVDTMIPMMNTLYTLIPYDSFPRLHVVDLRFVNLDTLSTPCQRIVFTDSIIVHIFEVDTILKDSMVEIFINQCTGDTVGSRTQTFSNATSIFSTLLMDTVHSVTVDTISIVIADTSVTTIMNSLTLTTDTTPLFVFAFASADTGGTPCQMIVTTDNSMVRGYETDSLVQVDTLFALTNHCTGGAIGNYHHLSYLNSTAIWMDTVHTVTSDTVAVTLIDTVITTRSSSKIDTSFVAVSSFVLTDTVGASACEIVTRTDWGYVLIYSVDSMITYDAIMFVHDRCTGRINLASNWTTYRHYYRTTSDTIHSIALDTAYMTATDTITNQSDSLSITTGSLPWVVDSTSTEDTLIEDGRLIFITKEMFVAWYQVDSTITTYQSVRYVRICDGTILFDSILTTSVGKSSLKLDTTYLITTDTLESTGILTVENSTITVYPNPCTNKLCIRGSGKMSVDFYDLTGNFIEEKNGDDMIMFTTEKLAQGSYIVSVTMAGQTVQRKILKE